MSQDVLNELDRNIREAKKIADVGDALERLRKNADFKTVIQEGFFEKEAIRLVHLKAEPNFQTAERQASIVTQMDAIGSLAQYLTTVLHKAALARKAIAADEETRDEVLAEGLAQ